MFQNPMGWLKGKKSHNIDVMRRSFDDIAQVGIRGEAIYDEENGDLIENSHQAHVNNSAAKSSPSANIFYSDSKAAFGNTPVKQEATASATPVEAEIEDYQSYNYEGWDNEEQYVYDTSKAYYDQNYDCSSEAYTAGPQSAHVEQPTDKENIASNLFPSPFKRRPLKSPFKPQGIAKNNTSFDVDAEEEKIETVFSKLRHNRAAYVKEALQAGFDINTVDSFGNSMLHICAQNNNKKMAQTMIKLGCRINRENKKGLTALDYAHMYKFQELIDVLVEAGADLGKRKKVLGDRR